MIALISSVGLVAATALGAVMQNPDVQSAGQIGQGALMVWVLMRLDRLERKAKIS